MLDTGTKTFNKEVYNGCVSSCLYRETIEETYDTVSQKLYFPVFAVFQRIQEKRKLSLLQNCTVWVLILHFC